MRRFGSCFLGGRVWVLLGLGVKGADCRGRTFSPGHPEAEARKPAGKELELDQKVYGKAVVFARAVEINLGVV